MHTVLLDLAVQTENTGSIRYQSQKLEMFDESYDLDESDDYDEPGWDDDGEDFTVACPNCGGEIYEDTPRCPLCGEYLTGTLHPAKQGRSVWWYRVAIAVVVLTVLSFALPYIGDLFRLAAGE